MSEDGAGDPAGRLARTTLLIDAHIDVPYRLSRHPEDVSQRTLSGDFDYPRARAGGLDVAFMAIYVPASLQEHGLARARAETMIDGMEQLADRHPDKFVLVRSPAAVRAEQGSGRIAFALGLENGAALEDDLANVDRFHARGVRYVTLTHFRANRICDSSSDAERPWHGLSSFGREVVRAMNRVGLMVDLSHVSDEAFDQVLDVTEAPVIASHSSCRHFTPNWERNLSDEMIRRLAATGGVIHVNFGSSFIDDGYRRTREAAREEVRHRLVAEGLDPDDERVEMRLERQLNDRAIPRATVAQVAEHIDHVIRLVGVGHVGLGSDFDGVGDSLPEGLRDVSEYPNLFRELLRRGYSPEQIGQIASGNLLRVWSEVERTAARLQAGG